MLEWTLNLLINNDNARTKGTKKKNNNEHGILLQQIKSNFKCEKENYRKIELLVIIL